jgi:hypothetical protein
MPFRPPISFDFESWTEPWYNGEQKGKGKQREDLSSSYSSFDQLIVHINQLDNKHPFILIMSRSRNPGSNNLFSSPESRIAESNRRLVEEQNNIKTGALADSVERLKFLSIDINNEVVDQNRLLGSMDGQMGSATSLMNDTLNKLSTMLNSGESKHMLYMIIFVVTAFVILYSYFFKFSSDTEETI